MEVEGGHGMIHHLLAAFRLPGQLRQHRFLLGQLAWRAFASRHAGAWLGWLWTPVSTVIQFALYVLVFSVILEIKIEGLGIDLARRPQVGFGVFLMTGLVPFLALNDAVMRSARVFRSQATLVQRIRLPAEVLVLGDVAGALLHHAVALVIVLVVVLIGGHLAVANLPWLLLGAVALALWVVGLSLAASILGAFLPDVAEALGLILQVMFYGAPIVYPLALVESPALRAAIFANPMTPLAQLARSGLLGAAPPPAAVLVYVLVGGAVLLIVGAAVVDRWRASIPDLV